MNQDTDKNGLLIFLHIPKTAGSTIHHLLAKNYDESKTYTIDGERIQDSYDELIGYSDKIKGNIACVKGHMPYGLHKHFDKPATYITFVRHPVNWVISYYYFILSLPNHHLYHETSRLNGIAEFCDMLSAIGMNDFQTRMLAGNIDEKSLMPPYIDLEEPSLDMAIGNIDSKILVTGVVEKFDESIFLMKNKLNWNSVFYVSKNINRSPRGNNNKGITRRDKEKILDSNKKDVKIYDYSLKKLKDTINKSGDRFNSELVKYRLINSWYGKMWPIYNNLRTISKTKYSDTN